MAADRFSQAESGKVIGLFYSLSGVDALNPSMTPIRGRRRDDPFIYQDPNKSRYSPRIADEQWKSVKPQIMHLLRAGYATADILRQLHTQPKDFQVTRSQLDTQIRKWDLASWTHVSQASYVLAMPNTSQPSTSSERYEFKKPDMAYLTTGTKAGISLPARESGTDAEVELSEVESIPFQLEFPVYKTSDVVQNLYQYIICAAAADEVEILKALIRTALLLQDMRCAIEAFEVWFLATSVCNGLHTKRQIGRFPLVFVATTCARSSSTIQQQMAATAIGKQVIDYLRQFFPLAVDVGTSEQLEDILGVVEKVFLCEQEGLSMTDSEITHYSTMDILLVDISLGGHMLCDITDLPPIGQSWSKDLCYWPLEVLRTLVGSRIFSEIICSRLTTLCRALRNTSLQDSIWLAENWPPCEDTSEGFAQFIGCLIVEQRTNLGDVLEWPNLKFSELFRALRTQSAVVLPHALVYWLHRGRGLDTVDFSRWSDCFDSLRWAIEQVRVAVDSNTAADHEEFVGMYLRQLMDRPKNGLPRRAASSARLVRAVQVCCGERTPSLYDRSDSVTSGEISQSLHHKDQMLQEDPVCTTSGPFTTRSYTASISSGYQSFKGLSLRIRNAASRSTPSTGTESVVAESEDMSWELDHFGHHLNPSVVYSVIDDVIMEETT